LNYKKQRRIESISKKGIDRVKEKIVECVENDIRTIM